MELRENRFEYVDDLIASEVLIGMNQDEIMKLLDKADHQSTELMFYYVGYSGRHFLGIDPDWLNLRFKDGVCVKSWVSSS